MDDELTVAINDIFLWPGKNTPHQHLPACVRERINWAVKLEDDTGIAFFTALHAVMADDDRLSDEFDEGWLAPSDEFLTWRDEPGYMWSVKQMQVAVELIYGTQEITEVRYE